MCSKSYTYEWGKILNSQKRAVGIIPARYASTRFPGKPLEKIDNKPMIQWVYERASQADILSKVWVATDDTRIQDTVISFGGQVIMTSPDCVSGTDRVAEAVQNIDTEIVVNIQGDEPFIHSEDINRVVNILIDDPNVLMGTLMKRIVHEENLFNPDITKVITDRQGNALYFSRHPIPFCRDCKTSKDWLDKHTYYKHIGLYGYRKSLLMQMKMWQPTSLESMEKLEQLRTLEYGIRIKVAETDTESISVDTPADLIKVHHYYLQNKKSIRPLMN